MQKALKFLSQLDSVEENGFVSRANFNAMLDMLEDQLDREAYKTMKVARKATKMPIIDSQYTISKTDELLTVNEAIIHLFEFAETADEHIDTEVI